MIMPVACDLQSKNEQWGPETPESIALYSPARYRQIVPVPISHVLILSHFSILPGFWLTVPGRRSLNGTYGRYFFRIPPSLRGVRAYPWLARR